MDQSLLRALSNYIRPEITDTGIDELRNRPRYDIDKKRYGNTVSDDMFAIKGNTDRHTPESYEYFDRKDNSPTGGVLPQLSPASQLSAQVIANAPWTDYRDWAPSRQKTVSDGYGVNPLYPAEFEGDSDYELAIQELSRLSAEKRAREDLANTGRNGQSLSEDMFAIKGGKAHDEGDMKPRYDANWDYYLGENVDYGKLSPHQLEMLVKMGVNRPNLNPYDQEGGIPLEEDASADLMAYLSLYKYYMDNMSADHPQPWGN